jgi:hypothetical protein
VTRNDDDDNNNNNNNNNNNQRVLKVGDLVPVCCYIHKRFINQLLTNLCYMQETDKPSVQ